jgi:hypothetical protein
LLPTIRTSFDFAFTAMKIPFHEFSAMAVPPFAETGGRPRQVRARSERLIAPLVVERTAAGSKRQGQNRLISAKGRHSRGFWTTATRSKTLQDSHGSDPAASL